jgi:CDP-diacylglycerol--glycerol-3-phosphate 3-phosphatidyltransferase
VNLPNVLSLCRIVMTPFAAWAVLEGDRASASVLLVAALATDFFDGRLARRLGENTDLGRILDPLADKVLVAGVLTALVQLGRVPVELAAVVVLRDLALLGFGWMRIRAGGSVPSAEIPGKVAFAILGIFLTWEVFGSGWPGWVSSIVGATYLLGGLPYLSRVPRPSFGRILKGHR